MGTIHRLPGARSATNVQLSCYAQDDGSSLYCVEVLFDDDSWDTVAHSKNIGEGWKLAGREANSRRIVLLPTSTFPGRAA